MIKGFKNNELEGARVIMDKAYESVETRKLVFDLDMLPVAPTKSIRLSIWEYDKEMYRKRNEVERLSIRRKDFAESLHDLKNWMFYLSSLYTSH